MSLPECIGVFLETRIEVHPPREPSHLKYLVQQISPSVFERVPENDDPAAFDRIRVSVGLPRYQFPSWEVLRDGVPINFLVLSYVTLLRDYSLEFIIELKEAPIRIR